MLLWVDMGYDVEYVVVLYDVMLCFYGDVVVGFDVQLGVDFYVSVDNDYVVYFVCFQVMNVFDVWCFFQGLVDGGCFFFIDGLVYQVVQGVLVEFLFYFGYYEVYDCGCDRVQQWIVGEIVDDVQVDDQ